MHQNTLADAAERLSADDLQTVLNGTAQRLAERGFFAQSKGLQRDIDEHGLAATPPPATVVATEGDMSL